MMLNVEGRVAVMRIGNYAEVAPRYLKAERGQARHDALGTTSRQLRYLGSCPCLSAVVFSLRKYSPQLDTNSSCTGKRRQV